MSSKGSPNRPFPILSGRSRPPLLPPATHCPYPATTVSGPLPTIPLSPLDATLTAIPASVAKQKTYAIAKSFRCNTYKKRRGGWGVMVNQSLPANHTLGSSSQIEELSHLAELLVARIQQFPDGLIRQRHQLPVQHFIQEPRRPFKVRVRAPFRLRYDFVDNAQLFQILRRNFHGRGGGFRFCRIAPDDPSAPLRRNHRVKTVLDNIDAAADGTRQRPARPAFAPYRDDHRHREPRHLAKL